MTSKINKNIITFNNKIQFNDDTFKNIIKQTNSKIDYTKDNLNSETNRNNSENKDNKKINYRPMTGIHPQINNNVMNININFYNIDMNKRFLIPDINLYNLENNNNNIKRNLKENDFIEKNTNDINLEKYKNSNEFLFQKIIKSIQEVNGNNKRLTIKDLS